MKYYAFDWDDNLLFMPTKIIVKNTLNQEVEMETKDFSIWRTLIGKKNFLYKNNIIIGFAENAFKNFRKAGDDKFIKDSLRAVPGPAWLDFVECINSDSIFAIITARGHNPLVIKNCIKELISKRKNGIQHKPKKKLENYLDKCKYYPVSFLEENNSVKPELLKAQALEDFVSYIKHDIHKVGETDLINEIGNRFVPTFGFSDDDEMNIKFIKEYFNKKNIKLSTYLTNKGNKILY